MLPILAVMAKDGSMQSDGSFPFEIADKCRLLKRLVCRYPGSLHARLSKTNLYDLYELHCLSNPERERVNLYFQPERLRMVGLYPFLSGVPAAWKELTHAAPAVGHEDM